jgi:arylsulfatase A-like enzyme/Flp pilus assembly protein TadD
VVLGNLLLAAAVAASTPSPRTSLVLITLDTFRGDHVGALRDGKPLTPNLDALARHGTRYARAIAPSPLTLPSHCTLLTGADPPVHGVHDNGTAALPADVPTLAAALAARGYRTGAVVASRVLDRRFGLARGFETYDDAITAEEVGGQGYPERHGPEVTDAALAWAAALPAGAPYFLWVHYYDAHAPYRPPGRPASDPAAARYAAEVALVDAEVGRLLAGLPGSAGDRLVAAVGDHGEMLGEHGEKEHGIFLYEAALRVPLIVAGPGIPAGRTVAEAAGSRGLAAALLAALGLGADAAPFGAPLPGLGAAVAGSPPPAGPVYSETFLPQTAYGWAPLRAATSDRLRLILAPRSELYDTAADPGEERNLLDDPAGGFEADASALRDAIAAAARRSRPAAPAPGAAEVAADLRSLGYLSGSSGSAAASPALDPKDGIRLLPEFDRAKELTRSGRAEEAARLLRALTEASPGNVPFLVRLGEAEAAAGRFDAAREAFRAAVARNPGLDFPRVSLGELEARAGRWDAARSELEAALAANPRSAPAWLALADVEARGGAAAQRQVLERAVAAGTRSATVCARLASLELAAGDSGAAGRHAAEALRLWPSLGEAWWVAGEVEAAAGRRSAALERWEKAVALGVDDARALVRVGRLLIEDGRAGAARPYLERAEAQNPGTDAAREARRLLDGRGGKP